MAGKGTNIGIAVGAVAAFVGLLFFATRLKAAPPVEPPPSGEAGYFLDESWEYSIPLPYTWQPLTEGVTIPMSEIEAVVFKNLEIRVDFIRGPEWYSGYGESAYYGYFTFDILRPGGNITTGTLGMEEIEGGLRCYVRVGGTIEEAGVCVPGKYVATVRMYPYYTKEVLFAEATRTFYIE